MEQHSAAAELLDVYRLLFKEDVIQQSGKHGPFQTSLRTVVAIK